MNLKNLVVLGLLVAPGGTTAAEEEKVLVSLVTTKPESGCYQLVDIVDETGERIETAAPGQTIGIRSRTNIVVIYDVAANVATATRKRSGE